jgi:hypothetical protein
MIGLMAGRVVAVATCLLLSSCGFLWKQVAVTTVNDCIETECADEHGQAFQQCMTACQREYGP